MLSPIRQGLPALSLAMLLFILLHGFGALATEIEVTYAFRELGHGWAQPDFEESTILATLTSTRPITLLEPDDSFVQLGTRRYTRIFHWYETDTLSVVFVDDNGEEVLLHMIPHSQYPFEPSNHTVPVICINTQPNNLWDPDTGIYVWGENRNWNQRGDDWERPAQFQYWDNDGSLLLSCPVGLRINGGYSRSYKQKSFRLYFDHNEDPESITHDFFGDGPDEFARLLVRSGMYPHKLMNDTWACSLFEDLGHSISRIKFTTVFLNGEHWGAFNIRERLDDEWLEITRGIDKDHFILIKDGVAENGDSDAWWDFLEWVTSPQEYSSHSFYQKVSSELNLGSYIDWLIINIFAAPSDNGYEHNLVLMKCYDDPWEFVMWDQDDLFQVENASANYFRFFSAADKADFQTWRPELFGSQSFKEVAPFFILFNHLMQNSEFRTRFSARFDELMTNEMQLRQVTGRMYDIASLQLPEIPWHAVQFWQGHYEIYPNHVSHTVEWMNTRFPLVMKQKIAFLQLFLSNCELSQFSAVEISGGHQLNWRTESETDCLGFLIQQSNSPEGPFHTIADYLNYQELIGAGSDNTPAEYSFTIESPPGSFCFYRLVHAQSDGTEMVHNWVELAGTLPYEPPLLCINEFLALNQSGITDETGQHEDWVEIFNPGEETIDLGGMFLTDNLSLTTRWEFPIGTSLLPGDFLLVWCDSDEEDGPLHASFKLSGAGESCAIFSSLEDGNELIDAITFGVQQDDTSMGRDCDGCQDWSFFSTPTPGATNNSVTPVALPPLPLMPTLKAYPNPFNPAISIEFEIPENRVWELAVYDPAGRLVKILETGLLNPGLNSFSWDGRNTKGHIMPAGVYYLRLCGNSGSTGLKITLIK